jgi:hypothetical protein
MISEIAFVLSLKINVSLNTCRMKSVTNFYNHLPDGDKLMNPDPLYKVNVKSRFTNQTKPEMKETARILTVVMVIIFGFAAIANTSKRKVERVQIVPCESGIFKMVYLKESGQNVQVGILDENEEIIRHDEISATEGFIKVYDLSELGSGQYIFRLQDSTEQIDQSVFYDKENGVAICQMGNTGKYKLVLNNPDHINVSLFDKDSQLVETDNFNSKKEITKVYDLSSKVDEGSEISFMIKGNNDFLKIATF